MITKLSGNINYYNEIEKEKAKYLQFGKYSKDCPIWLLDKVSSITYSQINELYIREILCIIAREFDPKLHKLTFTNDIKVSRFITIKDLLEKRQNSCGSKASVVASVLRNLNIPTKLIHGRYVRNNPNMWHAWNEVLIEDKWRSFDITRKGFELDEFHVKILEVIDWEEFESGNHKF